jgi:hypothetical protein
LGATVGAQGTGYRSRHDRGSQDQSLRRRHRRRGSDELAQMDRYTNAHHQRRERMFVEVDPRAENSRHTRRNDACRPLARIADPVAWSGRVYASLCTSATVEGLARGRACWAAGRMGESTHPRSTGVRKGSCCGASTCSLCRRKAALGSPGVDAQRLQVAIAAVVALDSRGLALASGAGEMTGRVALADGAQGEFEIIQRPLLS